MSRYFADSGFFRSRDVLSTGKKIDYQFKGEKEMAGPAPIQTIIGPKTARMQTVLVHGPEHLNRQVRGLGRDVPGAIHVATAFAYRSVAEARDGFSVHTNAGSFNRMAVPDVSTPYVRLGHPNGAELEAKLLYAHGLTVENNYGAVSFSSGMAAVFAAIITATKPGDEIIFDSDLYGCTGRLSRILESKYGRRVKVLNIQDTEDGYRELRAMITPKTTAIYAEVETNPHLKLNDVARIARLAHETNTEERRDSSQKLRVIIDNTFLGPLFCRPWELAKEAVPEDPEIVIVIESLTKILSGFGLDVGGVVIAPNSLIHDENWEDQGLIAHRDTAGGVMTPMTAFELSNRSLPTYIPRAKYAEEVAGRFARFLETVRGRWVSDATYPGLDSYPQRRLALVMVKDYDSMPSSGFMIGFNFHGDLSTQERAAMRFMDYIAQNGYTWNFMVSLGQVRSLAEVPAAMTHYGTGMPTFARISIGTESPEQLIEEATAAFRYAYLPEPLGRK